jgi:Fur family peroxide stress response transcriptional regulator
MNQPQQDWPLRRVFFESGCKPTPQRVAIYSHLLSCKDHPCAETIHRRVSAKMPTISLETVYRSLNKFEQIGMISRVHTTIRQGRFDANLTPHSHVICVQCDAIQDMDLSEADLGRIQHGVNGWGRVDSINLVLTGVCRKCLDGEKGRFNEGPRGRSF